jgi:glutamine synthetase
LVGFESEVIFLAGTEPPVPINESRYGWTAALHSLRDAEMVDEIVLALEEQGIGVTQFHAEGAPGQVPDIEHDIRLSFTITSKAQGGNLENLD